MDDVRGLLMRPTRQALRRASKVRAASPTAIGGNASWLLARASARSVAAPVRSSVTGQSLPDPALFNPESGESLIIFHAQDLSQNATPCQWVKALVPSLPAAENRAN